MDNLCHTLVGAAFGHAGLKQKTRFANATLMIAANLPDLDVLVFATEIPAVSFRRGWTHGILAQLTLPIALTAIVLMIGRWRRDAAADGPGRRGGPPLHAGWLLALSYIGIYSHVFLDFLNNYGVRLLTPFEWRWFYGDAVFIMDPWLWLALGIGVASSRWRRSPMPARIALSAAALYVGAMLVSARVARGIVVEAWRDQHGTVPQALMVGPVPINPFVRSVILDAGPHYVTGTFEWLPSPRAVFNTGGIPKNDTRPEVNVARQTPPFRYFLVWSRFPFYELANAPDGTRVSVGDMRFSLPNPLRDAIGRGRFTATTVVPQASD